MFYPVLLAYSFLLTGDCDCTAPMFCVLSIRRIRNLHDDDGDDDGDDEEQAKRLKAVKTVSLAQPTIGLGGHVRRRSKYRDFDGAIRVGDVDEQGLVVVVRSLGGYREVDTECRRTRHADVEVEQRPARIAGVAHDDSERTCNTNAESIINTVFHMY